jgi:lysophospholipase L1-like esterase
MSSSGKTFQAIFAQLGYGVASLIVIAVLVELAAFVVWSAYPKSGPEFTQLWVKSPVYDGDAWAPEFWKEEFSRQKLVKVYAAFRLWAVTGWHGTYINNDEGDRGVWRRTVNPANGTCKAGHSKTIWIFGGSTVYGTGVPDWATVPSYLARDLNASGGDCDVVTNFGVEGYVSNQELIYLQERLKTGQRPDMVIFYDGVNDASAAGPADGEPSPHFYYPLIKSRMEGAISSKLDFVRDSYAMRLTHAILGSVRREKFELSSAQLNAKATTTLDNYEANLRLASALSKAFNFKLYWFWQPSLFYGHKPLVPFEKNMLETFSSERDKSWSVVINRVYQEAERRAVPGGFVFLGDLFDSVKEPVYIDQAHLGPRGNELAASAVAKYIQEHPGN